MRVVLQRVTEASVTVDGRVAGEVGAGLMILLGVERDDSVDDLEWLVQKIARLRIFDESETGQMKLSLLDIGGEALVVSQFTLVASTRKGTRPSFSHAAAPQIAEQLYEQFVAALAEAIGREVPTGVFGGDMQVALVNDGPVTITIDSRRRE